MATTLIADITLVPGKTIATIVQTLTELTLTFTDGTSCTWCVRDIDGRGPCLLCVLGEEPAALRVETEWALHVLPDVVEIWSPERVVRISAAEEPCSWPPR